MQKKNENNDGKNKTTQMRIFQLIIIYMKYFHIFDKKNDNDKVIYGLAQNAAVLIANFKNKFSFLKTSNFKLYLLLYTEIIETIKSKNNRDHHMQLNTY